MKKTIMRAAAGTCFSLLFTTQPSSATPTQDVARLGTCFAKITGSTIAADNPLIAQVRNGQKTPAAACRDLLERAALDPATGRLVTDNATSRAILNTLHRAHFSWFLVRDFYFDIKDEYVSEKRFIYDATSPAMYLTKSLFTAGSAPSGMFQGNDFLEPLRLNGSTPGVYPAASNWYVIKDNSIFQNLSAAPRGDVVGFRSSNGRRLEPVAGATVPSLEVGTGFGGGVLGSRIYLQMNERYEFYSDGGVLMPRRWAKGVLHDFLCRDLPAVDVAEPLLSSYVSATSTIPFRSSAACVICHASMDQMAGVIRDLKYEVVGESQSIRRPGFGISHLARAPGPNLTAPGDWPAVVDANYYKYPTRGRLFFTDYKGQLVNLPAGNLEDLGSKLADLEEPYICMAKRYFNYFTGIDVDIAYRASYETPDTEDPRAFVIGLGKALRQTQDLPALIEAIIGYNGRAW